MVLQKVSAAKSNLGDACTPRNAQTLLVADTTEGQTAFIAGTGYFQQNRFLLRLLMKHNTRAAQSCL